MAGLYQLFRQAYSAIADHNVSFLIVISVDLYLSNRATTFLDMYQS